MGLGRYSLTIFIELWMTLPHLWVRKGKPSFGSFSFWLLSYCKRPRTVQGFRQIFIELWIILTQATNYISEKEPRKARLHFLIGCNFFLLQSIRGGWPGNEARQAKMLCKVTHCTRRSLAYNRPHPQVIWALPLCCYSNISHCYSNTILNTIKVVGELNINWNVDTDYWMYQLASKSLKWTSQMLSKTVDWLGSDVKHTTQHTTAACLPTSTDVYKLPHVYMILTV